MVTKKGDRVVRTWREGGKSDGSGAQGMSGAAGRLIELSEKERGELEDWLRARTTGKTVERHDSTADHRGKVRGAG